MPMKNNYPTITISSEGETWLQKGQMWMYRNNLVQANEKIPDGGIVNIVSNDLQTVISTKSSRFVSGKYQIKT